ncbi:MAG: DNA mismatch repair protein MutS [Gemmataceae bacterium]
MNVSKIVEDCRRFGPAMTTTRSNKRTPSVLDATSPEEYTAVHVRIAFTRFDLPSPGQTPAMSLTPMMQQYRDAKDRHPGMILLFRMGDFYELFEEDAEVASRILNIALTSRDKSIPMAGFPHHQLEPYLHKLIHAGHRVAICDQVEDPATAKGLVKREVTRVVTPGTVTEDPLLDPRQSNYLAAIVPGGKKIGMAWADLSTGHFLAADVSEDRHIDELSRLSPSECLYAEKDPGQLTDSIRLMCPDILLQDRPDWNFDPETARQALFEHFKVTTFAGFGFEDTQPCLVAAGALLFYLQETLKANLGHLSSLRKYRQDNFVLLDDVTRRSLELTRTLREGTRDGSLLSVIDRTVSPMGARTLHDWLIAPLTDRKTIEARLDAVEELGREHQLRDELRQALDSAFDLPRLATRVSTGRLSPKDLGSIAATLRLLPRVKAKITGRKAALLQNLETRLELFPDLRETLDNALKDDLPLSPKEGNVIREGYDPELDELRNTARGGKEWIAEFQAKETIRTGITSLKVGYNKVFGYYIEVTHAHVDKIPPDYQRKQTLKNAERYITPELKEQEEKVLSAEEKSQQREYDLFLELREKVAEQTHRLLQTAEVLATLDVLAGLAELAVSQEYTRPLLVNEPVLDIEEGRHPVLDITLQRGTFVPNDVKLSQQDGFLWLITGPNMSGKSTFIRQVALLTLMAQVGSFVPARRAKVGITDRIFTRVGASDELSRGHSTFMVEMTEAANILNNATNRSLVILDEIGRGTSTYDGVSLAWSITEYLHTRVECRGLFATHYHELAQLADTLSGLRNYNVQVQEWQDEIVFLHKIGPGSADKSYGIHVARLAGVPNEVLDRAKVVLAELEAHQVQAGKPVLGRSRRARTKPVEQAMTLFDGMED